MAKKIRDENGNVYIQKKPFYQRWWFILLVVAGLVGIFGNNNSSKNSQQSSNSENTQTEQASGTEQQKTNTTVEKTEQVVGMGQVVKVGDVEYIVHSKSSATNVGGDFGKNANGVYLILDVTVKNVGKKAITVDSNFFKLFRGDVEYSSDSSAGIYANEAGKFFLSELNPGTEIAGKVVFDVTQEVIDDPAIQLQVQTGVWGTQKAKINLQ